MRGCLPISRRRNFSPGLEERSVPLLPLKEPFSFSRAETISQDAFLSSLADICLLAFLHSLFNKAARFFQS